MESIETQDFPLAPAFFDGTADVRIGMICSSPPQEAWGCAEMQTAMRQDRPSAANEWTFAI